MKVAFAAWNGRMSPVFDVAPQAILTDADDSRTRETLILPEDGNEKFIVLEQAGVNLLVCGAISQSLSGVAASHGLQVIPFIAGSTDEVIAAFRRGRLEDDQFLMPGCRRRHRRRCGRSFPDDRQPQNNGGTTMPNRDGTGPRGQGPASGRGLGPCQGNSNRNLADGLLNTLLGRGRGGRGQGGVRGQGGRGQGGGRGRNR